jgi:Fe-S-cluster containining protein
LVPKAPPAGVELHFNCARCPALCCHYVSTEIDPPGSDRDVQNIRWYLMHADVRIFVDEEGTWYLQFMSRCRYLGDDNLCQIYETRPQICRDLKPTECEFARGPDDRHYFTRLEEFDHWWDERRRLRQVRRDRRQARANGRAPATRR